MKRLRIFDLAVDATTVNGVLGEVESGLDSGKRGRFLLAMSPEKVFALEKNPELKRFFDNADILIPDGIGLVWAIRILAGVRLARLTGADMMEELCGLAARRGYGVFFYGASEEVNSGAVEILRQRYAGLRVVGRRNGFVSAAEMEGLIAEINHVQPDIVFVALGSPRQENWMRTYGQRLEVGLFQGVGGTLDTITGHVKRAHPFVQRIGLEWLWRLAREPRRIRRQMVLPRFALRVIAARLGLTKG